MPATFHNKLGATVAVKLDGEAKEPQWAVGDESIMLVTPINTDPSDTFRAALAWTPEGQFAHETTLDFTCQKLDGSGPLSGRMTVAVLESGATTITSMTLTEN